MTKRYEYKIFRRILPLNWQEAEFYHCSFADINFTGVDFAKLKFEGRTDFCFCKLQDANFEDADLSKFEFKNCSNIPQYVYDKTSITPSTGDLIGWKKCRYGKIVQLLIPDGVPRHNATGRKCRAKEAKVLGIWDRNGKEIDKARSLYDNSFIYRTGKTVVSHYYDPDRRNECAGGIHFFLTREEAEAYDF